jgi:DNA-3-methyladenine glycosylase I
MMTYCQYVAVHPEDIFHKTYHDTEYGFPITDDNLLFERLVLEINQAGLSWITLPEKPCFFSLDLAQVLDGMVTKIYLARP